METYIILGLAALILYVGVYALVRIIEKTDHH